MDRKHVKPAPGMKVRFEDPSRGYIPADGVEVPLTSYYRRRKRDGDLLAAPQTKAAKGSLTMGSIAFNEIPRTIRAPGVFVEFDREPGGRQCGGFPLTRHRATPGERSDCGRACRG